MFLAMFLFQHEFVNRNALCAALMLPLITVLQAPPPKSRTPVDDDTEEELDENPPKVGVAWWAWHGGMHGRDSGCGKCIEYVD